MSILTFCLAVCSGLQICSAIQWGVFSTKTSYFWAHNASRMPDNTGNIRIGNFACKASHLNLVVRHGARNPTSSGITEISELYTKMVAHKDPMTFSDLDHWTDRYDMSMEAELVPMGAKEQEMLGKTYGRVFQRLLGNNTKRLEFFTSRKQRTIDSARSFYTGLASQLGMHNPFVSLVNDSLTRFYDGCARYEKVVVDNTTNFQQYDDFSKTLAFQNVSKSVVMRLGLNVTLTPEDLYTLYDLCALETYIFNDQRWCKVMTDSERLVLEYGMDVLKFYESMYGNPLNTMVACPLVRDVFYTMDRAIRALKSSGNDRTEYQVGKFQFGHSKTVATLLAALGLFRDQTDFMATNMDAMDNRKFRSSIVLSYSANVAFVLYACETSGGATPSFYIRFFVNEEPVALPMCGGQDVCPYETVRNAYTNLIDHCDKKQFCSLKTDAIIGR